MTTTAQQTPTAPPADPGDGTATAARLRAITNELADRYLERTGVVKALISCMLAGQHSLLLGPPGTAKSELARDLTGRVHGAQLWEILLSKYTDPKRMFGPIDVSALMQGTYKQVWDGRATQADIAFIDEIFKCGPAALNEMLALLNERLYHPESGGAPIACPLLTAITASNELPTGEESAAIYDRLLVRIEVDYLADPSNFAALIRSASVPASPQATPTTLLLADLQTAVRVHVPRIIVPDPIIGALVSLRATLRHAGHIASDRRWKHSVRLLQGAAYLAGRDHVDPADLELLTHVLWDSPAERPAIEREVLHLINPDAREALDIQDGLDQLDAQLNSMKGESRQALAEWAIKEANNKLDRAGKKLKEMLQQSQTAGRSTATLDSVIERHRAVQARVMVEALGLDPTMIKSGI
ncbi:AAA family ATPase [Nonomuraea sp. NPDC050790]|uniref:AAA family ATPase n=1 Tax=Nonomuraea sp. NPDC050790 TaxID=3364371 RepID=UPI003795B393